MKHASKSRAFTTVELIVVIAIILLLASILLFAVSRSKAKATRIDCVNNLKYLGTAYRVWSPDSSDVFPTSGLAEQGGLREVFTNTNQGSNCWRIYGVMANELGMNPRVLICPADERQPAHNLIAKGSTNDVGNAAFKDNTTVSYFAGIGTLDVWPQSFLGGDRNLAPGLTSKDDYGFSPANNFGNDVIVQTDTNATPLCWSLKMHSAGNVAGAGNILLGDSSVQQVSSKAVRELQSSAGAPIDPTPRSSQITPTSFRLIFP